MVPRCVGKNLAAARTFLPAGGPSRLACSGDLQVGRKPSNHRFGVDMGIVVAF